MYVEGHGFSLLLGELRDQGQRLNVGSSAYRDVGYCFCDVWRRCISLMVRPRKLLGLSGCLIRKSISKGASPENEEAFV